ATALVVAGGAAGAARLASIDRPARVAPPGSAIEATATLLEHPRRTPFGSAAPMRIETGPARGLRVLARVGDGGWPQPPAPGLRFRLRGLVRQPAAAAAGGQSNANA